MKWAFMLDSPDISGGTYVIYQHALYCKAQGDDVFLITEKSINKKQLDWHPEAKDLAWITLAEAASSMFDLVLATWWPTVFWLHKVPARAYGYFVQSVESKFYSDNGQPLRMLADTTYALPLEIITEAIWIQKHISDHFGRMPRVVRNGIRKDIYTSTGDALAPRKPGILRVLVEGPLNIPFKNVDRTIEICRRSKADEIWLLTSTAVSRYPGVNRVISRIPIHDTAAVYRSCDLIVKLSYVEGMFGPPLEMFHCGGTAIVYDVSGSDEYIRHGFNSLVVPSGREQQVIEHLNAIKDAPHQLEALKQGAAVTASEWPDWSQSSTCFRRTIEEISRLGTANRRDLETLSKLFHQFYEIAERYRLGQEGRSLLQKLKPVLRSNAPQAYTMLSRMKWFVKTRFRPAAR
jgi:O-antigen biosynthesis protein